jgi:hypothetical protein
MASDELRAAFGVHEPGAVSAGHFVKRRSWDLVDRGPDAVGSEVWGGVWTRLTGGGEPTGPPH